MEIPIYQPNEFQPHEVDTKKKTQLAALPANRNHTDNLRHPKARLGDMAAAEKWVSYLTEAYAPT